MSKIIALCGRPKAGKNEVGRILQERFGAVLVDDGLPLRLAASFLFHGVEIQDCMTQDGKKKVKSVCGKPYEVRRLLGDLGQMLEDHFGEFFVSEQVMKRMATLPKAPYYVLTACRKRQGHYFREHGGMVFDIERDVPESPYAFDWYDPTACHATISNRGTVGDLETEVARIMHRHLHDDSLARVLGRAPTSSHPPVDVMQLVKNLA